MSQYWIYFTLQSQVIPADAVFIQKLWSYFYLQYSTILNEEMLVYGPEPRTHEVRFCGLCKTKMFVNYTARVLHRREWSRLSARALILSRHECHCCCHGSHIEGRVGTATGSVCCGCGAEETANPCGRSEYFQKSVSRVFIDTGRNEAK
jgi:hypothetical protein